MKSLFLLFSFLLILSVTFVFSQQKSITEANSEVALNITVTDFKRNSITGLDKNAFSVNRGKEAMEITSF